jgi:hypothetical protein
LGISLYKFKVNSGSFLQKQIYEKIPVTKVVDPRIHFGRWSMPVREGGNSVSYLRVSATSLGSTVQFDIVPPSPSSCVVSRDMLWYNRFTLTCSSTAAPPAGAVNLVTPGLYDAPRAYPITSCVDSMAVQINNETITVNNWSDIGATLRRFNPRSAMYKLSNFCPWFPDQSSDYQNLTGSLRDVLSAAAAGDYDFMRGAYTRFTVQPGATSTNAVVVLETLEPVNLSPFMYGSQSPGIPFVQTLGLRFNLSNIARALSHAVTPQNVPITSVSFVHNQSDMFYQSIALPVTERIPPSVVLPHYRLLVNTSNPQNLVSQVPVPNTLPNGSTFTSQVINYPCVPSRIYVFCAPVASQRDSSTPDFTAQFVGGLSVQWNSRTALMTSVRREQLYSQAVDAGLASPWEQWDGSYRFLTDGAAGPTIVGGSGSILCIRPGQDYDLEPGVVAGQAGSYQFQVNANFNNQSLETKNFSMYVVAVLNGTLTINSGFETHVEIGVISQEDVLNATEKVHPSGVLDTYGGGFFDNIKSMILNPMSTARGLVNAVHGIANLAKNAEPIISGVKKAIGAGAHSGGSAMSGGADFYGGALLPKKSLQDRLR